MAQEDTNTGLDKDGLTTDPVGMQRDGVNYEPSIPVMRSFLSRRKSSRAWGTVQYPGLFDRYESNDFGWFWFTVVMEIVSLGISAFLLEDRVSTIVLIISALSVFFLDFTFAYFHHKYIAKESLIQNKKLLFLTEMRDGECASRSYADYAAYLGQQLKDDINRKYMRYVFGCLIWLLSLLKGGIFFVAVFSSYWFQSAVSDSKAPYLLIIVILASYIWIAFNHLSFSGYYLAALFSDSKWNSHRADCLRNVPTKNHAVRQSEQEEVDFKHFLDIILSEKDNGKLSFFTQKSHSNFDSDLKKGIIEIRVKAGTHFIKRSENKEDGYLFCRKGFLEDRQIDEMVKVQKSKLAELAVAMYFHKLQMASANFNGDE